MPRTLPALLSLALLLHGGGAFAQQATPAQRFERGVALSEEGDWRAALVEFQAAWDGTQNPEVLFNLAATHEHLNEYVEALDALERYQRLAPPRAVAAHRDAVVTAMARLVNRIGAVRLVTSAPSPRCAIDGVERPVDALRAGYRVSVGRRVVRCESSGYQPREVAVTVAPNAVADALVDLVRVRATIRVRADRAGAEVRVDGQLAGRTPLADPLVVDEGAHRVTVSLPGYVTVHEEVDARADRASVEATLRWAEPVPAEVAARLTVRTSEGGASASLDGHPIPADGSRPLPPGVHRLRVERENFRAVERDIDLPAGSRAVEDIALTPTPAYRLLFLDGARRQRRAWMVLGGAGVALTLAGAVMVGLYSVPALDADRRAASLDAALEACRRDFNCPPGRTTELSRDLDVAASERDALRAPGIAGLVILGVGLVSTAVGLGVLLHADPLDRFERPPTFRVDVGPSRASWTAAF